MAAKKNNGGDVVSDIVGDEGGAGAPTRYATQQGREEPQYVVATRDLYAYGVVAHRAGDRVPTVNVDKHGWADGTRAL
jgi:hypothetical protein